MRSLALAALVGITFLNQARAGSPRVVVPLNEDWRFHPGALDRAEAPAIDDTGWRTVDLPHDWAIEGPFDPAASGSQGKLPWQGEGWYRKHLSPPASARGQRMILLFDGVMANPTVYVNGDRIGGWRYGYNAFWLDATDAMHWGEDNVIAVHASTRNHYSRWYPGAGIYRRVTMHLVSPVHVPTWGVWIKTPRVSEAAATIDIETSVTHAGDTPATFALQTDIIDPRGNVVSVTSDGINIRPGTTSVQRQSTTIDSPIRWDNAHPDLYTARTTLRQGDRILDQVDTRFGIRTITWTAEDGFHLNGRRLQLQGVCLHHDNGPLGAAEYRRAAERKLRIMKDMGVNAIRTSHNPPSSDLLDLCDELGLLVIDELFDKYGPTASVDVSTAAFVRDYAEAEVKNFVLRDRNHPSVVLWSIGNEVGDVLGNRDGRGREHVETMHRYFKTYDPTRLTTMANHMTVAVRNGVLAAVDSVGWNYGQKYVNSHRTYPDKPHIYSESASAFSTRGYYAFGHPAGKGDFSRTFTESSYDRTAANWADIPDVEFMRMERDTYVAGEFVWTGFDYLGEPTPHTQAARSSYFGIVDLVGLPKDRYYLYRSLWNRDQRTTHLLPHWTWPDRVGKNVPVYLYTDGDEAELFLNGVSQGRRKKPPTGGADLQTRNLGLNRPTSASSEEIAQDRNGNVLRENRADKAVDGTDDGRWCAANDDFPQWWQVDLEQEQPIGYLRIDWEKAADGVTFDVQVSTDNQQWSRIGGSREHQTFGSRSILVPESTARYVRIDIHGVRGGWASIREVSVEAEPPADTEEQDPYYRVMDRYRLRWEQVTYQPGELKAISYRDGVTIGEAVVTTAGPATGLRLVPETLTMAASGQDLCYVRVEAVDADGRPAPHEMREVRFALDGPATIAGIGNGNPLCLDPFQDETHPLFYGKAILILRSRYGEPGQVHIRASAEGLQPAVATVTAN